MVIQPVRFNVKSIGEYVQLAIILGARPARVQRHGLLHKHMVGRLPLLVLIARNLLHKPGVRQ